MRRLVMGLIGASLLGGSLLTPVGSSASDTPRARFSSSVSFPSGSCSVLWANDVTECVIQVKASKGRKVSYSLYYRRAGTKNYEIRQWAKTSGSTARFELRYMDEGNPEQRLGSERETNATYEYLVVVKARADKRRGLPAVEQTHSFTVEWRAWDRGLSPRDQGAIIKRVSESLAAIACGDGPVATAVSVDDYSAYETRDGYTFSGSYILAPVFDPPVEECDDGGRRLDVWYDGYESWGYIWRRGYKNLDTPTDMAGIVAFDQDIPALDPTARSVYAPEPGDWIAAIYLTDTSGSVTVATGSVLDSMGAWIYLIRPSFPVTRGMSGAAVVNNLGELVGFAGFDSSQIEWSDSDGQDLATNWIPDTSHACLYVANWICQALDPTYGW